MESKAYSMVISFGILFKVQVPVPFLYFSESSTRMVPENVFWMNTLNPVDNLHFSANSLDNFLEAGSEAGTWRVLRAPQA